MSEATVGPAVLEIITSLLKQLERAVEAGAGYTLEEQTNASSETMVQFQHALFRLEIIKFLLYLFVTPNRTNSLIPGV